MAPKKPENRCPHCGRCAHCGEPKPQPTFIPYPVPYVQPYPYPARPYGPCWISQPTIPCGSNVAGGNSFQSVSTTSSTPLQ